MTAGLCGRVRPRNAVPFVFHCSHLYGFLTASFVSELFSEQGFCRQRATFSSHLAERYTGTPKLLKNWISKCSHVPLWCEHGTFQCHRR